MDFITSEHLNHKMRQRIRKKLLHNTKPDFHKQVRHIDRDNNIVHLICGHARVIHDKKYIDKTEWFCTECAIDFLATKNKEINEHLKNPISKPLKLK